MTNTCFCSRCGKTMDEQNFYTYKDGRKTEYCKKCLTAHIDNFNPDTFLWLLEKMDVPYVPEEWNVLRDRAFAKDPTKMNGMSVFGKYLSKMKLKQWKNYGWKDTEMLQQQNAEKREAAAAEREKQETLLKQQLDEGLISEAQYKTLVSTETQNDEYMSGGPDTNYIASGNPFNENNFIPEAKYNSLITGDLTEDDIRYLAVKWGRAYKPSEWVEMEKVYTEMTNSFDIQDADTVNTLILLCKTNLKMNQAIDCGDIDGYQKLSRTYDTLRKSAKFTAAQNKDSKAGFIDSVGELVVLCEKEGFIPRFATDIPQDKVDLTLKDMNNYIYKLVTQDLGFGQQIEDSIRKIQLQKEYNEESDNDENLFDEDNEGIPLETEDYEEFYNELEEQKESDKKILGGG